MVMVPWLIPQHAGAAGFAPSRDSTRGHVHAEIAKHRTGHASDIHKFSIQPPRTASLHSVDIDVHGTVDSLPDAVQPTTRIPLMKMCPRICKLAAAALLASTVGITGMASATDAYNRPASWFPPALRLVGVWDVNVTLLDCVSGNAVATFPAMNQYAADGSQTEVGINMSPAARYPSFGTWHFIGLGKFASEFKFFRFNPDGSYAGTQEVQRTITLSHDANQFATTASVAIYDPTHHLVKSGCATEAAVRR
jgi:hypothetical protein